RNQHRDTDPEERHIILRIKSPKNQSMITPSAEHLDFLVRQPSE
uniref:Uncharacterized protein n=1 Tax=Callorhinchus milii TaxID=7868 RepID=A0A4W3GED8_CALMI